MIPIMYKMFSQRELIKRSIKLLSSSVLSGRKHKLHTLNRPIKQPFQNFKPRLCLRLIHTTTSNLITKDLQPTPKELALRERYFRSMEVKSKDTFLKIIDAYNETDKVKRGHIEFIYAALKYMNDYGVQGDLEIYKKLMDVFPKGKMIPNTILQAEFFHFFRHQECATFILDQMEHEGLIPDKEMKEMILATFGMTSHVFKKYVRMLYWMPKLKNINPYLLPDPLPTDPRELARLALKKMSVDTRTKIQAYDAEHLEDSLDKTWIMSAQSVVQQRLIEEHPEEKALYVEGPTLVWLRKISMTYFILRADSKIYPFFEVDDDDVSNLSLRMFGDPKPVEMTLTPSSVHEQEEGIILGMCCTGTSSKDSLLSWIRFLRQTNPKLDNIPVLFKLRTSPSSLVAVNIGKEPSEEELAQALKAETEKVDSEDVKT